MLTITSGGKAGDRDTTSKVTGSSSPYHLAGPVTPLRLGVSPVSPVHA